MKPKPIYIIGVRTKGSDEMFTGTGKGDWYLKRKDCLADCKKIFTAHSEFVPIKFVPIKKHKENLD